MPKFTSDWFSNNIPAWNGIFTSLGWNANTPKTVVEIGSYEGRASLWILEHLLKDRQSQLHCVDVFADKTMTIVIFADFKAIYRMLTVGR